MPNPLSLSDAADLIDLSIQDIFLKGSGKESALYKQYYNIVTGVTDYYEKDSSMTGLSYAGRIVENASVTSQSPVQGYDKTYTQVQFGVLMSFTKPMWLKIATIISNYYNKRCKLQENPIWDNLRTICSQANIYA